MDLQNTRTSSESSDDEADGSMHPFLRRMSTVMCTGKKVTVKEGYLTKQTGSFQRGKRRYFTLHNRSLFFSKEQQAQVHQEIDLQNASVADRSSKTNHVFTVITPHRTLVLSAENRKDTEDWLAALQSVITSSHNQQDSDSFEVGMHHWYSCSHARPTYCNVCNEALGGVRSSGLSCDICKFKAHKHCAKDAPNNCKWVTLKTMPQEKMSCDDQMAMDHQWLEGNLPGNSKCVVCEKACGSARRLQDWRCLWCRATVHSDCLASVPSPCSLGPNRVSILPPTAIRAWDMCEQGRAEAVRPPGGSPLLVFVNSKSGDNEGMKFLRRFKQLLNPAQVFDLITTGPFVGLHLFQSFESFRILICGGDGSVGWVLMAIDKLGLTNKCQVGILPLGTGNDLARVLGWGSTCDDNSQLPQILNELESSGVKMLDRWSIQTKPISPPSTVIRKKLSALPPVFDRRTERRSSQEAVATAKLEKSVASHLAVILSEESRDYDVIDSTRFLCEHIQAFVSSVCEQKAAKESCTGDNILRQKCLLLSEKLESLMSTLQKESQSSPGGPVLEQSYSLESTDADSSSDYDDMVRKLANIVHQTVIGDKEEIKERQEELEVSAEPEIGMKPELKTKVFRSRDAVMARANSLKKAVKQIIEHAEETLNQQVNQRTAECFAIAQSALIHNNPAVDGTGDEGIGTTTATSDRENEPSTEEDPMPNSQRTSGASDALEDAAIVIQNDALLAEKEIDKEKGSKKKRKKKKLTRTRFTSFDSGLGSSIVSRKSKFVDRNTVPPTERFMPNLSAALLAGANALVAPVTAPATFEEKQLPGVSPTGYSEVNVMNNYFGIGIDAKISLEFHNKREEHPEKCRSRMLNRMWYGMLGGKQFISQTYKNLDQRIKLECDGKPVQLPTIQGIVVLNIASYMGGVNFWGTEKDKEGFFAPSFNDRMLEVVAVTSYSQMAQAYVLGVQSHRLAQCRSLKITVLGDEPVPCQVDGEAWLQDPCQIKITHKNRAQMLARDKAFYSTLQSWRIQGGCGSMAAESPCMPQLPCMPKLLPQKNLLALRPMVEATTALISSVKVAAISNEIVECELLPLAHRCTSCIEQLFPAGSPSHHANTVQRDELIQRVKQLIQESGWFVSMKKLASSDEAKFSRVVARVQTEMRKIQEDQSSKDPEELQDDDDIESLPSRYRSNTDPSVSAVGMLRLPIQTAISEGGMTRQRQAKKGMGKLKLIGRWLSRGSTHSSDKYELTPECEKADVFNWSAHDVAAWLERNNMGEYKEAFVANDIQGRELLSLERQEIREIGVTLVGHIQRLLGLIRDLREGHTDTN